MQTIKDKAASVLAQVNWERAELAGLRGDERPAEALVAHLERPPRPAYHFEIARKADVLAFLSQYASWRTFSTKEADRLVEALPKNPNATRGLRELGLAWWATGNPQYAATFEHVFLAHDTGSVEPDWHFRSLAAQGDLQAYLMLQDCPALSIDGRIAFFDHLLHTNSGAFDQVLMDYRHVHIGPNGHNYWSNSSISLPELGLLFPEFTRSAFFLRAGDSVLEEHMRNNYKADGGSRETAFAYQAHTMIQLWTAWMLHAKNGVAFSPAFRERLFAGTQFILRLMTPRGGFPKYGDSEHAPGQLTLLAAIATAATADGEFKWYAEACRRCLPGTEGERPGHLPHAAFWHCGLAGARVYEQTRAQAPALGSVLMAPTGLAALRDGVTPTASYLAIIAAERGPFVTSHGHSDIFSLDVTAGGERFIGEPVCKMYGYSEGRQYELSTASKSTLMVNGRTQVGTPEPFRFDRTVIPTVLRWISAPTHDFFHGVHEAYFRHGAYEALHERKIFFLKASPGQPAPGYWVVLDYVEAVQANDYTISFQGLHPGKLDGTTALLHAPSGTGFAIVPPAGDALTVSTDISPARQAFLKEYGFDAEQHPSFIYRLRATDACLVWVLAPLTPAQSAPAVRRIPVQINGYAAPLMAATAVEIDFGGCRDILCVSHKDFDSQLEFADETVWGNLAFRRIAADGARLLAFENTVRDGVCGR